MFRRITWGCGLATALCLAFSSAAYGNILDVKSVGRPVLGGSWFQDFYVYSPTSFTNLGVWVGGAQPQLEGFPSMDFSKGGTAGWFQVLGPSNGSSGPLALSVGPSTNDLIWRAHFTDPVSQPFTIYLFAFNNIGSNIFSGARASWSGTNWTFSGLRGTQEWYDFQKAVASNPVPLPAGLILGAVGLLCAIGLHSRAKFRTH